MKKIAFFLFLSVFTTNLTAQQLSLTDVTSGKYSAKGVNSYVSSADGEHYFQTDNKNSQIIKYSYKTGLPVDTVFDVKKARNCTFDNFQGFMMSPDEHRLIVYNDAEGIYRHSFKANYFYYDIRRNLIRPLTENKEKQMCPVFSKDGRMLAFVVDNNIWLAKFDYDSESQVTKDGEFGKIINGATDWVYEEEFGTTQIMDFSADGRLLAFVKFDEAEVPQYSFPIYGSLYPTFLTFKYPKAGEKNSTVSCNVFDVDAKTIRPMNLPTGNLEYIPRIAFLPEGDQLAIMTLNRDQNEFNLYIANARSAVCKLALQDKSQQYIDSEFLNSIHFFGNQFTYISEKSGYSHIYLYDNTGVQQKALTNGNYDVMEILAIDNSSKTIYYQAAEESPLRREIYKIDAIKGTKTKLSAKAGYNRASFSNNGKYYINTWSDAKTPSLITINDAMGKDLRTLEDNKELIAKLSSTQVPQKEFTTIATKDGTQLNAWIMKPINFNPNNKYPLVMVQYSGPNSQQVLDRYGIDWMECLAAQGFVIACVDGRGTGARGADFRKCTYMNLGIKESDDQIAAAEYLGNLSYIDKNNIGIWGWSYGGYNVLMSMSRSNVFKAGVAIAPVTDWRFYDSVYSERFMRTPQQNALGYNNGSPIKLASSLKGNLLLIHGSADDNVHFQNTINYANALIDANKDFDMFVMPDRDHSMRGSKNRSYVYGKTISYFKNHLKN